MNQAVLPSYEDRKEEFAKVRQRILGILFDHWDGLTKADVELIYIQRFKHVACIDNRLRELRKAGEVQSFPTSPLQTWKLNPAKWRQKK